MTEKGRRLTIERINKYKEEVDKKEKEITIHATGIGLDAIIIILASITATKGLIEEDVIMTIASMLLSSFYGFYGTSNLIKIIKAISRKTGIEINIENLEAQLKEDEFEREEEGKSR